MALWAPDITRHALSKMAVQWIWIMHLFSSSMVLWLGIRIIAAQSPPVGKVILEEALTRLYWWVEQNRINATFLWIQIHTVGNVLNHCSFFMPELTSIWHNRVGKAKRMERSQALMAELTLMTERMGLVLKGWLFMKWGLRWHPQVVS